MCDHAIPHMIGCFPIIHFDSLPNCSPIMFLPLLKISNWVEKRDLVREI